MERTLRAIRQMLVSGLTAGVLSGACASCRRMPEPVPPSRTAAVQDGYATYLAPMFHGRTSASGERFDERRLVAAHRTLPFGSVVRVTNVKNGRSVTVRIIDRGPYGKNYREGTIIDLSRAAAGRLRMLRDGQVPARLEVVRLGE
jgi:rare lipoprotein A